MFSSYNRARQKPPKNSQYNIRNSFFISDGCVPLQFHYFSINCFRSGRFVVLFTCFISLEVIIRSGCFELVVVLQYSLLFFVLIRFSFTLFVSDRSGSVSLFALTPVQLGCVSCSPTHPSLFGFSPFQQTRQAKVVLSGFAYTCRLTPSVSSRQHWPFLRRRLLAVLQ